MKTKLQGILERAERAHREARETIGIGARLHAALTNARGDFRRARSEKSLMELLRLRNEAEAISRELGGEAEFVESARAEVTESPEAFEALAETIEERASALRKTLAELRKKYAETLATAALAAHSDPLDFAERPQAVTIARDAVRESASQVLEIEFAARRARNCARGSGRAEDSFETLLQFAQ